MIAALGIMAFILVSIVVLAIASVTLQVKKKITRHDRFATKITATFTDGRR